MSDLNKLVGRRVPISQRLWKEWANTHAIDVAAVRVLSVNRKNQTAVVQWHSMRVTINLSDLEAPCLTI